MHVQASVKKRDKKKDQLVRRKGRLTLIARKSRKGRPAESKRKVTRQG
jgi:ribosomal protein L36